VLAAFVLPEVETEYRSRKSLNWPEDESDTAQFVHIDPICQETNDRCPVEDWDDTENDECKPPLGRCVVLILPKWARPNLGGRFNGDPCVIGTTTETKTARKAPRFKGANDQLVRLSVNLNAETAEALREIADHWGISATEAVRRAISVYKFIDEETQEGSRIQTVNWARNEVRELVLMWPVPSQYLHERPEPLARAFLRKNGQPVTAPLWRWHGPTRRSSLLGGAEVRWLIRERTVRVQTRQSPYC
jgi:hypothetical protein